MGEIRPRWRFPDGHMHWRLTDYRTRAPRVREGDDSGERIQGPALVFLLPSVRQEVAVKINWPSVGATIELVLWTFAGGALGAITPIVLQDVSAGSPIVWKSALAMGILMGLGAVRNLYKPSPSSARLAATIPPAPDTPRTAAPPGAH